MPATLLLKTCKPPVSHAIRLSDTSRIAILEKLNNLTRYVEFYFLRVGVKFSCDLSGFPDQITLGFINLASSAPASAAAAAHDFPIPALTRDLSVQFVADHNALADANRLSTVTDFSLTRSEASIIARIDDVEQLYNAFLASNYHMFTDLAEDLALNLLLQQFAERIEILKNPGLFSAARRIFVPPAFSTTATGWLEAARNTAKRVASSTGYQVGHNTLAELFDLFLADQKRAPEARVYFNSIINRILNKNYTADMIRDITSDDHALEAGVGSPASVLGSLVPAKTDDVPSLGSSIATASSSVAASPAAVITESGDASHPDTPLSSISAPGAGDKRSLGIPDPITPIRTPLPTAPGIFDTRGQIEEDRLEGMAPPVRSESEKQPKPKSKINSFIEFVYHRSGTAWLLNQPAHVKFPILAVVATGLITGLAAGVHRFAGSESSRRLRDFVDGFFGNRSVSQTATTAVLPPLPIPHSDSVCATVRASSLVVPVTTAATATVRTLAAQQECLPLAAINAAACSGTRRTMLTAATSSLRGSQTNRVADALDARVKTSASKL